MTRKTKVSGDSSRKNPGEIHVETASGSEPGDELIEATDTEALQQALGQAEAKAEQHWNQYLRAAAELDNVRKRAGRDLENAHKFAIERFAGELLSVKDSLEMGLEAAADADADALREGKAATLRLLIKVFEDFGISAVDPEGEPFDPEFHEAMTTEESARAEPGTVLRVIQKGYLLNGRLLRPARVVVAREAERTADGGKA